MNSQHAHTNTKGYFVLIIWFTNTNHTQIWYGEFNQNTLRPRKSSNTTRILNNSFIEITKLNLSLKYIIYSYI